MFSCVNQGACTLLKASQEVYAHAVTGAVAATQLTFAYRPTGNCSALCTDHLACVATSMLDQAGWLINGSEYNKSAVMEARQRCLSRPTASSCLNLLTTGLTLQNPKSSICLNVDCYYCGLTVYEKYFNCALACGQVVFIPHVSLHACAPSSRLLTRLTIPPSRRTLPRLRSSASTVPSDFKTFTRKSTCCKTKCWRLTL